MLQTFYDLLNGPELVMAMLNMIVIACSDRQLGFKVTKGQIRTNVSSEKIQALTDILGCLAIQNRWNETATSCSSEILD